MLPEKPYGPSDSWPGAHELSRQQKLAACGQRPSPSYEAAPWGEPGAAGLLRGELTPDPTPVWDYSLFS